MNKKEIALICAIVLISFALRLYKISRPIADWHSWRQADTAAVARNFIKEGYNPFVPRFDDMSAQTNGRDNPNRYRFVEFPIYNSLIYFVWQVSGISATSARLVTVLITIGSTVLIYFLTKYFSGPKTAAIAAFLFATLPYNVFYSSTILPGPLMVFALLAFYLSFLKWLENEGSIPFFLLSIIFANIAILTWPVAIFFLFPALYLVLQKHGLNFIKKPRFWLLAILSLAPFIAWRIWMLRFPEGIPNWRFLLNENNIRFKGAFFKWLIAERIGKLILTVNGFALFIIGLVVKPVKKENLFYLSWLFATIIYFIVFASGNVRHDYYQIPAVPVLVIFMAKGLVALFDSNPLLNKNLARFIVILLLVFTYAFGIYEVRGYYWINKPQIIEAGQAVDRLLPKDATIIAPYNGDSAFLYQTNRYGYPITDKPLEKFIDQGTKYLVSVDVSDSGIQNLTKNCRVVTKTASYVIVEMFQECIGK